MLAASLQDAAWHDLIGPRDRPFLFVAEAVFYYLEPDDVARFIRSVSAGFPASSILLRHDRDGSDEPPGPATR